MEGLRAFPCQRPKLRRKDRRAGQQSVMYLRPGTALLLSVGIRDGGAHAKKP